MKTIYSIIIAIVVALIAFFALNSFIYNEKQEDETLVSDPKDGWYLLSGEWVHLENGFATLPVAPESSMMRTITYFGNEVRGDIDNDGDEDVAFLITEEAGGSGTFFYLVAAIKEPEGYRGTHAMLIGDRVAPQTTEFKDGLIIVNYADRAPGEPFTAPPSVGKSLYAKYDPASMQFGEVVKDFEGEAVIDSPAFAEYFQQAMFEAGTADGLIPIEGFDAGLLLGKFPGLVPADFEGVEAFEGVYSVQNGEVVFTRTQAQPVSSAERTVSTEGYSTLLQNLAKRLDLSIRKDSDIDALVDRIGPVMEQ